MYEIKNHSLFLEGQEVEFIDSPNIGGVIIPQYVIEHFTGATTSASTKSWFKVKKSKVSAHLLIDRDGKVTQFVRFNLKAWHAGESSWGTLKGLNSHSIGIELVNVGRVTKVGDKFFFGKIEIPADQVIKRRHKNESVESYWQTYTEAQLRACKEITNLLVLTYNLKGVLGHDDIAPGRKADPGPAFPMEGLFHNASVHTYRTTANVNLRLGSGTQFKSLQVLLANTKVNEIRRDGDWSQVTYKELTGWVNNKYLTIS